MASMLVRVGWFVEVESVLSRSESREILLDCQEIFSYLIEGYVREFGLERAICTYDRMRGLSLVPTSSSYQAFLKYLINGLNETQLMYNVYVDTIKIGLRGNAEESSIHENVVRLLCIDGIVQEARDLVRKVLAFGIIPGKTIIDAICCGCCEKKDFDDILSFFAEMRLAPGVLICKKILFSLGKSYGVEQTSLFMEKREELGFCPDERTLGILIGFSSREMADRDLIKLSSTEDPLTEAFTLLGFMGN